MPSKEDVDSARKRVIELKEGARHDGPSFRHVADFCPGVNIEGKITLKKQRRETGADNMLSLVMPDGDRYHQEWLEVSDSRSQNGGYMLCAKAEKTRGLPNVLALKSTDTVELVESSTAKCLTVREGRQVLVFGAPIYTKDREAHLNLESETPKMWVNKNDGARLTRTVLDGACDKLEIAIGVAKRASRCAMLAMAGRKHEVAKAQSLDGEYLREQSRDGVTVDDVDGRSK